MQNIMEGRMGADEEPLRRTSSLQGAGTDERKLVRAD